MELNVISFNIRCRDDENGNSIAERAPRLDKVIQKYEADIIGFQEVTPAWMSYIEKYFGDEYVIFNKYRCETKKESGPVLWKKDKFECVDKGYFWLSDTPEVESKGWDELFDCHRICTYAVLEDKNSGVKFTVMNTHYGFGDKCQIDSSNLIYDYSKKISDYPTFVTGDFNMKPDSLGYMEMTKNFTDVNAITDNDLSATYHGYHPGEKDNSHIDYCFVDETIKPIGQEIIKDTVNNMFPTDHYGLYIKLQI